MWPVTCPHNACSQTVMSDFYVQEVLKGAAASSVRRRKKNGPPLAIKLLPDMSQAVFQQNCAPAHNATKTQKWYQASLSCFWPKEVRPGHSPDLSPIENLSVIVQHKVDKMATATSEVNLIRNVRSAWRSTSSETPDNPMCGIPKLMRVCAEFPGDYINI